MLVINRSVKVFFKSERGVLCFIYLLKNTGTTTRSMSVPNATPSNLSPGSVALRGAMTTKPSALMEIVGAS